MTHPFLAALLRMAAEEHQHEESLRLQAEACDERYGWWDIADQLRAQADENAGRAEVYERFAHRIIAELAEPLLLAEFERATSLSGPADLLEAELPFTFSMDGWQRDWNWERWMAGRVTGTQYPLVITTTN